MDPITLLVIIAGVALLLWLFPEMNPLLQKLAVAIAVICFALWVLGLAGWHPPGLLGRSA